MDNYQLIQNMRARCPVNQKVFASGGAAAQQNTESVLRQGLRGDS